MTRQPLVTPESYARWRATTLGSIAELVEARVVFGLAGALADKRVLDAGAGDGTYAIEAEARGARVTALDSEQPMLDAAQARAQARGLQLVLRRGRVEELPFADGAFDVVLAVTVLCFVPDVALATREMARVLSPGGRLVLADLSRFSVWAAERRVRAWLGADIWRLAHFRSRRELVGIVEAAGLRVDAVRGSVFFAPNRLAARVLAPFEPWLTRIGAPGAAFVAIAADKPGMK